MGVTLTAWGAKAREVLGDGKWHDREQVVRAVANAVPPGRAFRVGEQDRNRKRPNGAGSRTRGDGATSIEVGARKVARNVVESLVKRGTAERDGDRIRLVRP